MLGVEEAQTDLLFDSILPIDHRLPPSLERSFRRSSFFHRQRVQLDFSLLDPLPKSSQSKIISEHRQPGAALVNLLLSSLDFLALGFKAGEHLGDLGFDFGTLLQTVCQSLGAVVTDVPGKL